MKAQKIINLLEDSDEDTLRLPTRKWYIINDQNNAQYGKGDENDSTIKFDTAFSTPNLCDYSNSYVLITRDIAVVNGNNNTKVCFKNCSPFIRCATHLNDEHIETAENLDLVMNLCNLVEYSGSYSNTSGSLFHFKGQEQNLNAAGNIDNVNINDSSSFRCKSSLLEGLTTTDVAANVGPEIVNAHRLFLNTHVVVPLKLFHHFLDH